MRLKLLTKRVPGSLGNLDYGYDTNPYPYPMFPGLRRKSQSTWIDAYVVRVVSYFVIDEHSRSTVATLSHKGEPGRAKVVVQPAPTAPSNVDYFFQAFNPICLYSRVVIVMCNGDERPSIACFFTGPGHPPREHLE